MSFLDDLIRKGASLLKRATPTGDKRNVIASDMFDEQDWSWTRTNVPVLDTQIHDLGAEFDYVEELHSDLFQMLFQSMPRFHRPEQMQERFKPNHDMLTEFRNSEAVQRLRTYTRHDIYSTALAMVSMHEKIEEAYRRLEDAQQKAAEAEDMRQQALDLLQSLPTPGSDSSEGGEPGDGGDQGGGSSSGGSDPGSAMTDDELAAVLAVIEDMLDAADQASNRAADQASNVATTLASAANEAAEEAAEEAALCRAFGMEDGELKRMSFDERQALARRLRSNRLAAFAKQLGQFRTLASGQRRHRVKHLKEEIVSMEIGSDLERVASDELTNLAVPDLEDDFWRRVGENEIAQYEMEGVEIQGQGPIIVVCDESGSMDAALGPNGTRESWSKALALGLLDTARQDHRDFTYIGFSSSRQVWQSDFPNGQGPIDAVIEFTEHFWSGGTSYEGPLTLAAEIVSEAARRRRPRPDIVFITDDEYTNVNASFLEQFNKVKTDTQMRVFGIMMGGEVREGGALESVSDITRTLDDLSPSTDEAVEIFRLI